MSYTKEEWFRDEEDRRLIQTAEVDVCRVSETYHNNMDDNANLISASPDLLEACEEAHRTLLNEGYDDNDGIVYMLNQAINKAKGVNYEM